MRVGQPGHDAVELQQPPTRSPGWAMSPPETPWPGDDDRRARRAGSSGGPSNAAPSSTCWRRSAKSAAVRSWQHVEPGVDAAAPGERLEPQPVGAGGPTTVFRPSARTGPWPAVPRGRATSTGRRAAGRALTDRQIRRHPGEPVPRQAVGQAEIAHRPPAEQPGADRQRPLPFPAAAVAGHVVVHVDQCVGEPHAVPVGRRVVRQKWYSSRRPRRSSCGSQSSSTPISQPT